MRKPKRTRASKKQIVTKVTRRPYIRHQSSSLCQSDSEGCGETKATSARK